MTYTLDTFMRYKFHNKPLTEREIEQVKFCLEKHAPNLVKEFEKILSGVIDIEIVNEIRSAIMDEFVEKGLQEDDEANKYRLELEDLNGRLANIYIWPE